MGPVVNHPYWNVLCSMPCDTESQDSTTNGVKPVHLELGGKTPQLVLSDCDNIDHAVEKISLGIFVNSGQVCTSIERVYVFRNVAYSCMYFHETIFTDEFEQSDIHVGPVLSEAVHKKATQN